ncbi:MAG: ATP-binding protein [Bacteroidales bacterium]|nr:ATP-binding protein [Bacteroidales bacterium]
MLSPITYEGIHRREKLEYPYQALREAILNAIIHRNYLTTSAIQIRIYHNKLIIMNEGILPDEIKIEDLKRNHLSKPRNTLLADVFYKSGFIESWGRGTLKIVAECINENLPEPEFENRGHLFSVTFLKADLKADLKISSPEEQIISIISTNNKVSISKIAIEIGKGITVTKEYMNKLKAEGILKRIGPDKGGHWEIVTPNAGLREK